MKSPNHIYYYYLTPWQILPVRMCVEVNTTVKK